MGRLKTMKRLTLAAAKGFEVHGRATRKAAFLAKMETLAPWAELGARDRAEFCVNGFSIHAEACGLRPG